MSVFDQLAATIARVESGGNPNSVSAQNNNPGNLVYSPWESSLGGSPGGVGGFAQFPTPAAGQTALQTLLAKMINQGKSITQIVSTWAGTQYGNSQASVDGYVAALSKASGLDPNASVMSQIGEVANTVGAATDNAVSNVTGLPTADQAASDPTSLFSDFSPINIASFVGGVVCLLGGLLLLKQTQTIIQTGSNVAKKTSKLVASVG